MPFVEVAAAQTVPLPRPRPFSNSETAPAHTAAPVPKATPSPSVCRLRLTPERAIAPSVDDIDGPGGCGGADIVRLEAVVMSDNSRVEINPPAVLQCSMAEAIANWVRDDLAELAAFNLGSRVRSVRNYASYHCRPRNNIIGAMMSEHGKGNAIDVRSITLVNGQTIDPTDVHVAREFREGWKKSVCARFSTVLGPGSDGYHENHIHVDLMVRRNGYRAMCQWDVRMPAEPKPESAVAAVTTDATAGVPLPTPRPKVGPKVDPARGRK
ncbi:MAG: extensin [Rhizobiales bacterium]|nr:extensin [Hyphomicrobiales bacterium]